MKLLFNFYYLHLLKRMKALKNAGEEIPESLIQKTLNIGKKAGIPPVELAVLESISENTTFH